MNAPAESAPALPYAPAYAQGAADHYAADDSMMTEMFRYVAATIRRHFWLGLAIILAVLAAVTVFTMFQTPEYTAVARIQINDEGVQVLGSEMDSTAPSDAGWDVDRFINTQMDVLRSRNVSVRVIRSLGLLDDKRFFAAMQIAPPAAELSQLEREEYVLSQLYTNLEIELPQSSRIVKLAFTSTDSEVSAKILNSYLEEFIATTLQNRFDSSAYARDFVTKQLEEARVLLESSERELNMYARSAGLIRTRGSGAVEGGEASSSSITTSSLMQFNEAANNAKATRVAAESRWSAEKATPIFTSQTVLANPTVQTLMTRKSDLESRLQTAGERYLPDHPTVLQLAGELDSVQAQLNRTAANVRNSIRSDYLSAQAAERELLSQVNRLRGETLEEQDLSVRYNTLAREADTNRSIYDGLLQRFRELNAASGIAASNITIIDKAQPPILPSSPRLMLNLLIGLLGGGALAVGFIFIRDQLDDVIHLPEDVESKLGLSLLGVIPLAETGDPDQELSDSKSALYEAYSSVRGALLFSTQQGLPRVLSVTSTQGGEGKSTTCIAIAAGLTRMGRRVILVDGDMRRPSIHQRLDVGNETGLVNLLTSSDPTRSAIQETSVPGLDVITAGQAPPSPSELLNSPRMAAILEELASEYDAVLVDCPPIMGLADAPAIAGLSDGTMLVIEADRAHSGQLRSALRRLRQVHPVILGAVLTKFDPSKGSNRYSSYYGYDYYSYADKQPRPSSGR